VPASGTRLEYFPHLYCWVLIGGDALTGRYSVVATPQSRSLQIGGSAVNLAV
jgi:hypothetical protein